MQGKGGQELLCNAEQNETASLCVLQAKLLADGFFHAPPLIHARARACYSPLP